MSELPIVVDASPVRCPFCRETLDTKGAWLACAGCLARHHPDCWREAGACASCQRTDALDPALAQHFPSPREKVAQRAKKARSALRIFAIYGVGALTELVLSYVYGFEPRF